MYTAVRSRVARRLRGRGHDAGFSLVESLVAMVLLMIMTGAVATALIAGNNATEASRTRIVETNLVQADLNSARALPTPTSAVYTTTAGGNAYVVTRSVSPAAASPCPTGSLRRIDVTARWGGRSVAMSTAVTC